MLGKSESEVVYKRGFKALETAMELVAGVADFSGRVKQTHGDWAAGLSCAFHSQFLGATRVADFSHLLGCNRRPRHSIDLTVRVLRAGIMATLKPVWRDKGGDWASEIREFIFATRTLPRCAFTIAWRHCFRLLQSAGESEAREKLRRYYFDEVEGGLDAAWRGSTVDRVQPGSLLGSQPQESFHQHRLRPGLGSIRLSMDKFMENLTEFMETRAEQATQFPPFHDLPEMWQRNLYDVPHRYSTR